MALANPVMGTSVPAPACLGDVIVYIEPGENDAQRDQGHGPEQPCILDFQPCTHHQIGNRLPAAQSKPPTKKAQMQSLSTGDLGEAFCSSADIPVLSRPQNVSPSKT